MNNIRCPSAGRKAKTILNVDPNPCSILNKILYKVVNGHYKTSNSNQKSYILPVKKPFPKRIKHPPHPPSINHHNTTSNNFFQLKTFSKGGTHPMAEQEQQIATMLADHIEKLTDEDKKLLYGVALGMDLAKNQTEE
jgi:hypothetical protein